MASRRQKKQRALIIMFIFAFFVVGILVYYGIRDMKAAQDPGYGGIGSIHITGKDTDDLNDTGDPPEGPILSCIVFNCGDALSVLIDIGDVEVLYDTGYAETGDKLVKGMQKYINGSLDYLILSHSHADHVGGTPAVAKAYEIDTAIVSGETDGSSSQYDAAQKALQEEGCRIIEDEDAAYDLGSGAVLNIIDNLDPQDTDNPNDLSIIARVKYGKDQILITGDSEKDAERSLIGKINNVTLLVAGHHMSNTSNTLLLLKEWDPKYIFVSCKGKDSQYGFPHRAALERCLSITSEVYATFKSGDLIFSTNGKECGINQESDKALKPEDCPL